MISPAFFVASMVGFHVEFSHSMYSSKWPYSTPISCTRVTGPSVYWRSSWARALSGSEEVARHMDRIMGLIIFYAPVVMYLYSANTRIKPNLSRVSDIFMQNRKLRQFIIITIIVPLDHDSVIRREKRLRRRPCSMICAPSLLSGPQHHRPGTNPTLRLHDPIFSSVREIL